MKNDNFSIKEVKYNEFLANLKKLKQRDKQEISADGLVVHPEDAIWLDSKATGNPTEIGILVDIPAKSMEFYLQRIPANSSSDLQRHVHESIHYVLEGEGYSEIGNQVVKWSKGDFVYTPPWIWHRHYNPNDSDVRMLLIENSRLLDSLDANRRESLGLVSFAEQFKPEHE
ncbi:cupin domain-containing protein [Paenibacillus validus]|uniref:cupin domain-containing protein n=1 Tax=Paenibacillus validus TaxID=44253 RepID=UPI000FD9633B|nr:cupin domain-containing protein [Paenibacillus validus]MED4600632.1 cupin domain-containing protein [Paenibacillus validus]MED4606265.1 cupin domain-containing protein [Paenibacillus validus]